MGNGRGIERLFWMLTIIVGIVCGQMPAYAQDADAGAGGDPPATATPAASAAPAAPSKEKCNLFSTEATEYARKLSSGKSCFTNPVDAKAFIERAAACPDDYVVLKAIVVQLTTMISKMPPACFEDWQATGDNTNVCKKTCENSSGEWDDAKKVCSVADGDKEAKVVFNKCLVVTKDVAAKLRVRLQMDPCKDPKKVDPDGDGFPDIKCPKDTRPLDNCPGIKNPDQKPSWNDPKIGEACTNLKQSDLDKTSLDMLKGWSLSLKDAGLVNQSGVDAITDVIKNGGGVASQQDLVDLHKVMGLAMKCASNMLVPNFIEVPDTSYVNPHRVRLALSKDTPCVPSDMLARISKQIDTVETTANGADTKANTASVAAAVADTKANEALNRPVVGFVGELGVYSAYGVGSAFTISPNIAVSYNRATLFGGPLVGKSIAVEDANSVLGANLGFKYIWGDGFQGGLGVRFVGMEHASGTLVNRATVIGGLGNAYVGGSWGSGTFAGLVLGLGGAVAVVPSGTFTTPVFQAAFNLQF